MARAWLPRTTTATPSKQQPNGRVPCRAVPRAAKLAVVKLELLLLLLQTQHRQGQARCSTLPLRLPEAGLVDAYGTELALPSIPLAFGQTKGPQGGGIFLSLTMQIPLHPGGCK